MFVFSESPIARLSNSAVSGSDIIALQAHPFDTTFATVYTSESVFRVTVVVVVGI